MKVSAMRTFFVWIGGGGACTLRVRAYITHTHTYNNTVTNIINITIT